jgi:hypothetical protein
MLVDRLYLVLPLMAAVATLSCASDDKNGVDATATSATDGTSTETSSGSTSAASWAGTGTAGVTSAGSTSAGSMGASSGSATDTAGTAGTAGTTDTTDTAGTTGAGGGCFPDGIYGSCAGSACFCLQGATVYEVCSASCTDASECGDAADFSGAVPGCFPLNPGSNDMICVLLCSTTADCPCGLECMPSGAPNANICAEYQ